MATCWSTRASSGTQTRGQTSPTWWSFTRCRTSLSPCRPTWTYWAWTKMKSALSKRPSSSATRLSSSATPSTPPTCCRTTLRASKCCTTSSPISGKSRGATLLSNLFIKYPTMWIILWENLNWFSFRTSFLIKIDFEKGIFNKASATNVCNRNDSSYVGCECDNECQSCYAINEEDSDQSINYIPLKKEGSEKLRMSKACMSYPFFQPYNFDSTKMGKSESETLVSILKIIYECNFC